VQRSYHSKALFSSCYSKFGHDKYIGKGVQVVTLVALALIARVNIYFEKLNYH